MEALGFPFANRKEESAIQQICNLAHMVHLTNDIIEKTIEIRKQTKIKLPDAIIAATAIRLQAKLITANVTDFKSIDSLSLINPLD